MDTDDAADDNDGGGNLWFLWHILSNKHCSKILHMLTHILSSEQPCKLSAVIFSILWIIKQNITILGGSPRFIQLVNGKGYSLNAIISK